MTQAEAFTSQDLPSEGVAMEPTSHEERPAALSAPATANAVGEPEIIMKSKFLYFNETELGSRKLANWGDWDPWPTSDVRGGLDVVHHLCDQAYINALQESVSNWSARSQTINLRLSDGGCKPTVNQDLSFGGNLIKVVYGTCAGSAGGSCCGQAQVKYVFYPGGRITGYQALIRLDPGCFSGGSQDTLGKRYVACHEMGHALGLGHNSDTDSCLSPNNFQNRNMFPGSDDIRALDQVLYPEVLLPPPTPGPPTPRPPLQIEILPRPPTVPRPTRRPPTVQPPSPGPPTQRPPLQIEIMPRPPTVPRPTRRPPTAPPPTRPNFPPPTPRPPTAPPPTPMNFPPPTPRSAPFGTFQGPAPTQRPRPTTSSGIFGSFQFFQEDASETPKIVPSNSQPQPQPQPRPQPQPKPFANTSQGAKTVQYRKDDKKRERSCDTGIAPKANKLCNLPLWDGTGKVSDVCTSACGMGRGNGGRNNARGGKRRVGSPAEEEGQVAYFEEAIYYDPSPRIMAKGVMMAAGGLIFVAFAFLLALVFSKRSRARETKWHVLANANPSLVAEDMFVEEPPS